MSDTYPTPEQVKAIEQQPKTVGELARKLEPHLRSLVDAAVHDWLCAMMPRIVEDALAKQRKDVGDELVRILLEKAFKELK